MIEAFEFENIRLKAPQPKSRQGDAVLLPHQIDQTEFTGMSTFSKREDAPKLDRQLRHIYQTRIGNPDNMNSHLAAYVPDRLIGMGTLAPGYQEPEVVQDQNDLTSSQRLSSYLDSQVQFVPAMDKQVTPSFNVNSQDAPFLSPGLTNIDSRKLNITWS